MESEEELEATRQRKKGGGRKSLTKSNSLLVENFLKVLSNHTAGDPMREDVKWTNLSRRQISRRLKILGTPAGKNVVAQLLWQPGYRRRKSQKKRTMGQHADRNAQFENIAKIKNQYLSAGHPVISIDTKNKEQLGNFHREGVTDAVEPMIVNDHDLASASDGKVIPYGKRACKGVPLESIETARHYIEKTETTKGLNVVVRMLEKVYVTGCKYAKDFKETMTIKFDEYLLKWNDTAIPELK